MEIVSQLAQEYNTTNTIVENIIELLEAKNTIPFIARYRKEQTGNINDEVLRQLVERWEYLTGLEDKKTETLKRLEELGHLTDELKNEVLAAQTLQRIEDLYRPFRPKRRTRASMAIEKGLKPLADLMIEGLIADDELLVSAKDFLTEDVETIEDAINGAKDIVAEQVSDDANHRALAKKYIERTGKYKSKGIEEDIHPYEMYEEHEELYRTTPGYRVLAMNRGEKEKKLRVGIEVNHEQVIQLLEHYIVKGGSQKLLKEAIEDGWKRLMFPALERELRQLSTETAQEEAISVFGRNLRPLLMQAPLRDKVVLALDPGFRTGCKVVVLGREGQLLDNDVIYPTEPRNDIKGSMKKLLPLISKYSVDYIAIGNGTASRETEQFVAQMIDEHKLSIFYTIVNEAGASIYSASELGKAEFPDHDVTVRGAVSIGRRLQDPIAELVKIHPRNLGVGQYQHDLNNQRLDQVLTNVVEDCVNTVGVDLNTASPALMEYVSGVNSKVAKSIVEYRTINGRFTNRKQLKEVKGLGAKTFEQCAGFMRIADGNEPLDNTAVHPESYELARRVQSEAEGKSSAELAELWEVGLFTLKDILAELEKPGRDPRDEGEAPLFRQDVLGLDDLDVGMTLSGQVRNVVDFGAFVDIGVKQDGLIHITEMSDKFCKDPHSVLKVGDKVDVTIINLDKEKERIGLSMRTSQNKGKKKTVN
ncbi:MAG: RNA-binding transcriptional accessory protein [Tissierellia bacterium]|nr:RNA-binding transcriptional accessory protein [Tissierellia bacterium]